MAHRCYIIFREKEEPQEQPLSAFGFFKTRKAERINSEW